MAIRDELELFPSGAMLRAARGLVGVEQTQLAQMVGVTRKTIFAIEHDHSQRPDERRTKIVRKIRDYFIQECHVLFLYEQDGLGEGVRLLRKKEEKM
jgi:DNA-binding XRE family transcriptional regulator